MPTKTDTRRSELEERLIEEIHHRRGCPNERGETYEATRPNGEVVTVARCIDCGAATIE